MFLLMLLKFIDSTDLNRGQRLDELKRGASFYGKSVELSLHTKTLRDRTRREKKVQKYLVGFEVMLPQ